MPRLRLAALIAAAAAVAAAAPASAATPSPTTTPTGPWDGTNPFKCVNQDVGTGTDFPFPDADPFCVEFDKTGQNITDFGIVDFLANEPARTAAAGLKCFYFQQDHWTGSIVQNRQPELWHWDGRYYFDKAKGTGGVSIHNFQIGGQPADFRPYVPDAYKPYFYGTGGGGVKVVFESDPDPVCGAMVDTPKERRKVYRGGGNDYPDCIAPGGGVGRHHVGRADLGTRRRKLRKRLGRPRSSERGVDRWCVVGAANLRVAYSPKGRAEVLRTTAPGQTVHGVGAGSRAGRAKASLGLSRVFDLGRTSVSQAAGRHGSRLLVGVRAGRVRWLALASGKLADSRARADLQRAR